jgi:hypothetical protein
MTDLTAFDSAVNEVLGEEAGYVMNPALCSAEFCGRNALAKGLCNAHYLRSRAGSPMNKPISARIKNRLCRACDQPTGAKGGHGLCRKHYNKSRRGALKVAAVASLGGKCADCGGVFHPSAFDFHHLHGKDADPSRLLAGGSAAAIAAELSKCVLLCANCHRIRHHG